MSSIKLKEEIEILTLKKIKEILKSDKLHDQLNTVHTLLSIYSNVRSFDYSPLQNQTGYSYTVTDTEAQNGESSKLEQSS